MNQAKIVLANTEIVRIEKLIKKATKRFSDCLSCEELHDSPFSQGDDFTDELTEREDELLDGLGIGMEDLEISEDLEYVVEEIEDFETESAIQSSSHDSNNHFEHLMMELTK